MNQVYAFNYFVNRQLGGKEGKMTSVFVDLKAAFDSVHRGKLIEAMWERGVREGLIKRIEEMVKETRSRVRVGEKEGERR